MGECERWNENVKGFTTDSYVILNFGHFYITRASRYFLAMQMRSSSFFFFFASFSLIFTSMCDFSPLWTALASLNRLMLFPAIVAYFRLPVIQTKPKTEEKKKSLAG